MDHFIPDDVITLTYFYMHLETLLLYKQSREVAHLQDAIQYGQNAFPLISLESPKRLTLAICLGQLFTDLYDQTYDLNHLTQAIK